MCASEVNLKSFDSTTYYDLLGWVQNDSPSDCAQPKGGEAEETKRKMHVMH